MEDTIKNGQGRRLQSMTSPETTSPVCEVHHVNSKPEFIRLPKPGERCPWTGLTRGSLNDLILGPSAQVKSLHLAQPGATRGIRMIHFGSLMAHLHDRMEKQDDAPAAGKEGK